MDGARPSSGAAATSRGPDGNRHPDGSAESRAHDARTLSTMDGTLRDSCERIRDRVAELAGDARPRVVSEMEAALSQVEYDLNGAEFLLAQLREALAVSAPPRDAPPVAAYRASLRGSRSALDAVREAARLARPRAAGDARRDAGPGRLKKRDGAVSAPRPAPPSPCAPGCAASGKARCVWCGSSWRNRSLPTPSGKTRGRGRGASGAGAPGPRGAGRCPARRRFATRPRSRRITRSPRGTTPRPVARPRGAEEARGTATARKKIKLGARLGAGADARGRVLARRRCPR